MKKGITVLLIIIIMFTAMACGDKGGQALPDDNEYPNYPSGTVIIDADYPNAKFIKNAPLLYRPEYFNRVIRDEAGLDGYIDSQLAICYENGLEDAAEEIKNFDNEYLEYDSEYFASKLLFIGLTPEDSGSVSYKIQNIAYESNNMYITVKKLIPDMISWDLAFWAVIIEVSKTDFSGIAAEAVYV